MKKVFVKPEMKSYKLRTRNLLYASGQEPGQDNPGAICLKEIDDCKPQFGCFTENKE